MARAALWLLLSHATPWTSRAVANLERDMLTTATDLTAGASYAGGGTPGTTWDVTFTTGTYGATTFTVNANLGIGTVNVLNATQALILTSNGSANRTLTLNGGTDSVAGSAAADLIYLAANARLTIQNGSRTLGLALAANGNFDTATGAALGISSVISGNFNLAKTGAGTLTLGGTNTFGASGKTFTLSGGTLNLNAAAALGNNGNTFVLQGGTTVDNTSGAAITTSNYAVTVNGDFTFAGGGTGTTHDLNLGTGAVTLGTAAGTSRVITVAAANSTLRFGGVIANGTTANAVIKSGAGILTFSGSGANTYTGGTVVAEGTLILMQSANVSAVGTGTLQIGDGTGANDSATVQLGANGQIADTVVVDVGSNGKFNLNNFSETIAGLILDTDTAQGATVSTGTGTLTLGGNVTVNANGTGATGADFTGNLNLGNAARTFTVANGSAANGSDLDVNGVVSSTTAASGSVVKAGAGTLRFSGTAANTYTGMTTVNAGELLLNKSAGILAVVGGLTIGDGAGGANSDIVRLLAGGQIATTAAVLVNGSSGLLDLNGFTQTIGSLADSGTVTAGGSSVNLGGGTLTVGNTTSTVFSGAITGSGGSLVKQGTGMLTLAGVNTYTGATVITAGTLQLRMSGAIPAGGNVTILGGALDIAGQGPVIGSITFGDGTATGANALSDSATVKGAVILNGDIAYNGTAAHTFQASLITAKIQLAAGVHSLSNPNSQYSSVIYDVVLSGVMSGPGGISKDGTNTLYWVALNAANTYSGVTNVTGGRLYLGVVNAIPSLSAVDVSAGAMLILNPTVTENGVVAGNYSQSVGSLAGGGSVTLGSATLTTGNDGTSEIFSGVISGTGAVVKTGGGGQTFTGANTHTGGTTLTGGTLVAGNNAALGTGTITFNGGGLGSDAASRMLANAILVNNAVANQITGGNSLTLTGAASGTGTLAVNFTDSTKAATINPTAANAFAPAMLRLASGTLTLGGSNKIGDSTRVTMSGGRLNTGGFSDSMGALAVTADSVLDFGTSNTVRLQFSSASWTGGTLNILNWTGSPSSTGNADQFLIGSGPVSSDFLNEITFDGYASGAIALPRGGGLYEISPISFGSPASPLTPVPEPGTIFGAAALIMFVGWRERRRLRRFFAGA
jgi:autotransporter-associated beta strand protein